MALVDAFEQMLKSPRLKGVRQEYGASKGIGEDGTPRILWVPVQDSELGPARVPSPRQRNIDGKPIELVSYGEVWRSAELEVSVPATGDISCYRRLEDLLDDLYISLRDALGSWANYRVGPAPYVGRDEMGMGAIGATVRLSVLIPITARLQTAQLQAVETMR